MTYETWLTFIVASFVVIISPGPAILMTINNALRFGVTSTLYSSSGNTLGIITISLLICFGLGELMAASIIAFNILKVMGACYLIYLGIKALREQAPLIDQAGEDQKVKQGYVLFLEGILIAITNPKAWVLLAALFPQFMYTSSAVAPQVFALSLTYGVMTFGCHLMLAYTSGSIRSWISSPKRMKFAKRFIGGTFIGFGAALAVSVK